jgi:hypothetical protein
MDETVAATEILALVRSIRHARVTRRTRRATATGFGAVVLNFAITLSFAVGARVGLSVSAVLFALERLGVGSAFFEVAFVILVVADDAAGDRAAAGSECDVTGFAVAEGRAENSTDDSAGNRSAGFSAAVIAVIFTRARRRRQRPNECENEKA